MRHPRLAGFVLGFLAMAAGHTGIVAQERGPRFLVASARHRMPVPLDVARTPVLLRRIVVHLDGVPLRLALTEVSSRAGLSIAYGDNVLPVTKRVHLRAEQITVAAALTDLLVDVGVDIVFNRDGGATIVRRSLDRYSVLNGSVTGRVTDAKTGDPLNGVDVSLEGTRWRATTDADGRYRIAEVAPGSYAVLARRIGYAPERRAVTVTAGQEATGDVALQPAATRLGDVIVTAQKREERLQDVPLSIAVVTPEEIDRRGLISAEDYLRGIPGVNQMTDNFGQSIVIRGIETSLNQQNFVSGATVATYFGEAPTTNSAGLVGNTNVDVKLVDIERVEVLRGPQGTAFGSAALGGAVRTIPVAPKLDRVEGKLGAAYSATAGTGGGNYNFQATGNLPLFKDKIALRATGYRFEESGFYRNAAGSDPAFQAAAASHGAQAFAVDADDVGASRFTGGRMAALFQASDNLTFTLSYLTQETESDATAVATTGTYEQKMLQVAPEHVVRGQRGGLLDTGIDLANAVMEYDLGWANLLATYSYIKSGSMLSIPILPDAPWSALGASDHRQHSGEIRLTTQIDGAWNFLGGVYAEDHADELDYDFSWYGSPESDLAGVLPGTQGDRRNLKQKAAFAEASWQFLPGLTLTGGVRAYDYDRTGRGELRGPIFGGVPTITDLGTDASGTSFRGNLSHKFTDNALVYADWSQGFRLGTPQLGLAAGACDIDGNGIVDGTSDLTIESTRRIESDNVDNYELGGKFTLLDQRLTIAADVYRIDWTGLPLRVFAPGTRGSTDGSGCGLPYTANAGAARSEGIEFQANLYVTEALRVDIGGSYVRARLTADAPGINAVAGDRLPGSPEVNASLGLQYEFTIGGSAAFVRVDPIYVGPFNSFIASESEAAQGVAGDYVKVDASARVAIRHTNIDLFVRNLTNADEFTFGGDNPVNPFSGFRLRPRTIGLQLSRNF